MIKPSKKQLTNIVFIVFLLLFLFTPLKFLLSVYVNKLIALTPFATPSTIDAEEQVSLKNYEWKLVDENGNNYDFKREKGKVVFVNFWATWCPPCVAEMPDLQKLYDDYRDKVTFLFIANDQVDRVNAFLKKNEYTFATHYEYDKTPTFLEHSSIPTTYLINRSGKIVMKKAMVADWNSEKMRAILNELIAEK